MITYYVKENNEIIKTTPFEGVAQKWENYETTEKPIIRAWDGKLYFYDEVPPQPAPTHEEQREKRAEAYRMEKDPITCQIQSLRDEEQTPEVVTEIEELKAEREAKVEEIKQRYPYPEE